MLVDTIQCWFADDAASGGNLKCLRDWWGLLTKKGPQFGYYPNAVKTFLLVKPEKYNEAANVFQDTGVEITCTGRRYLGGTLGTRAFEIEAMKAKVTQWVLEIRDLSKVAETQPHAAYAAFTHALIGRWTYSMRVFAMSADEVLKPLEEAIAQYLIPALTKQPAPATVSRDLLALPARLGGLGIVKPITWGKCQQETSAMACKPLTELILKQEGDVSNATLKQRKIKKRLQQLRRDELRREAENTITALPLLQQKCARLAQEKGCSSWLVAIPIQRLGFTLHKGAFQDALCLRYGCMGFKAGTLKMSLWGGL